ncbi:MAG: fibronectin type III domain-containing protein, partial [Bacillota bacterium]
MRTVRLLPAFLAIVMLMVIGAPVTRAQYVNVTDYVVRGEQYLAAGAADSAIFQFEQALALDPGNTRALFGLGRALETRSKVALVLDYRMELLTDTSAAMDQGFPPLTDQGYSDVRRAIDAYLKAAAGWPRYPEANLRAARLQWASGLTDDARATAERAFTEDPSLTDAAALLAAIMAESGDLAGATSVLDRAVAAALDRSLPSLSGAYGVVYMKQSRPELAVQVLLPAALRPDAPAYLFKYLGDAYAALGQHPQAISYYQQAAFGNPQLVLAREALGRALRLSGQPAAAAQHLAYAASVNPALTQAVLGHGAALVSSGAASAAVAALQPVVERLSPYGNDSAYLLLAIAVWKAGDPYGALAAIQEVLRVNPGNKVAELYRARIAQELGIQYTSVPQVQARALTVQPTDDKPFEGVIINDGAKATNNRAVTLGAYGQLTQVSFSNDSYTWSNWLSKPADYGEFSWELAPGDGQKTVYMRFRGFLGLAIRGESDTIILDTKPPAATARLTPLYGNVYAVDLQASDDTGIAGFWMSYDGNDWEWFDWRGPKFSVSVPTTQPAGPRVLFSVVDGAGNHTQIQATVSYQPADTTPPVISSIQVEPDYAAGARVTWRTDEMADSFVEYWTVGGQPVRVGTSDMSTFHSVVLSNLWPNVTYYYTVVSSDAAGNTSRSPEMMFRLQAVDVTPPTVSVRINGGAQLATSTTVQLEVYASDDQPGDLEMAIRDDLTGFTSWTPYSAYTSWRFSSEGRRTVTVKVRDAAGNEAQASASITVDASGPVISRLQVGDITPNSATVTWTTNEASDTWVMYGTTALTSVAGTYESVLNHRVTLQNLSPNTTYYYKVRSQDAAGNVSESATLVFRTEQIADRTPPTGSITINNGAAHTRYNEVQLAISAQDDFPGALQMRLREGSGSWSAWGPLQTSMWYRLSSGDGQKTVSVEFMDAAGNRSRTYSASITLDTRAPRITNVRASVTTNSATITWNTDEPAGSRVEFGTVSSRLTSSAGATAFSSSDAASPAGDVGTRAIIVTPVPTSQLRTSHSVTITGLSPSTTYYYQGVSVDAAGKVAVQSGFSFTTASTTPISPPTGSITINNGATHTRYNQVQLNISARSDYPGA